ncbi:MAG: hypothetical protein LAT82_00740 [Nanoarchaeota archaeon]|nr:hypothetical protein [Nanoarchaeota archaeon]
MQIYLDPTRANQFEDSLHQGLREGRLVRFIKDKCDKTRKGGQVFKFKEEIGTSKIIKNPKEVFWGYRRGRELPSRISTDTPELTREISLIGFPHRDRPDESYFIKMLFTGNSTGHPELRSYNPKKWTQERFFESVHYWGNHAIAHHKEHIQAPTSTRLEELFQELYQTGNLQIAGEFQDVMDQSRRYLH